MAQFTSSSKNSCNEVLVKCEDDALHYSLQQQNSDPPPESSVSTPRTNKEPLAYHGSDATIWSKAARIDNRHRKVNRKDYSWFMEDDFDIACSVEQTSSLKKKRLLKIVQWVLLLLLLAALSCMLYKTELKGLEMWEVSVWKWELLLLVVICGHLVSGWGVRIAVLLIESNFHLKIGVLYVVYGIRKSIQNFIWLSLVTVAWHFIVVEKSIKDDKNQVPHILRKIMICFLVGTFIWLLKTLVVKLLDASFHLRSFFKRIRVSLYKQYVIKKLDEDQTEGKKRAEVGNGETKNTPRLSRQVSFETLAKKKIIALKVKKLIETIQLGDLPRLSTVVEDLPIRSDEDDEDELSMRTRDEDVEEQARQLFRRVAQQSDSILQKDLERCLGKEKLRKAQELFTGAMCRVALTENGFTRWMVDAYRERITLALSLNDTKTAVDDLHHMMDAIVAIMILIVWLIICGAPVTRFLIFMTTQLAIAVYVFGGTGKTVFESIIFLFIMHPYDVGDRCEVDGVQMIVDEMTILNTVFLTCNSQKIIYPNCVLAMKPIGNYSRSPAMGDAIEFSIHISTPGKKIDDMKDKINRYINKKGEYWFSNPLIVVKDVEDMNKVNMVMWPKHVVNHHDMGQRWKRRSELIEKMIRVFRKLEIEYRMLPVEINVRNIGAGVVPDRPPSNWGMPF